MSDIAIGLLSFPALLGLIFLRVPIGLAMFLAGLVGMILVTGETTIPFARLKSETYTTFSNYSLSIVPMFLLMGHFATLGGMSQALFKAAEGWLGHRKGGVAMAAVGCLRGLWRDLWFIAGDGCHDEPGGVAGASELWLCRRVFHGHVGGRRHPRDPDPAIGGSGDLCHPDRAEHRQAVLGCIYSWRAGCHRLHDRHRDLRTPEPRIGGHATARFLS